MRAKLLRDGHARVHALVFDVEDEAVATLTSFANEHGIEAAHFTAIGAFELKGVSGSIRLFSAHRSEPEPAS